MLKPNKGKSKYELLGSKEFKEQTRKEANTDGTGASIISTISKRIAKFSN